MSLKCSAFGIEIASDYDGGAQPSTSTAEHKHSRARLRLGVLRLAALRGQLRLAALALELRLRLGRLRLAALEGALRLAALRLAALG